MKSLLSLPLLFLFAVEISAQNKPAQFAVTKMTASGGVISISSDEGKTWKEITRGSDPALSPNGQFLAYTYYQRQGTSHDRYIRIINLKNGQQTEPQKYLASSQQYGASWDGNDRILFKIYVLTKETGYWSWQVAKLSYPKMDPTGLEDSPSLNSGMVSPDGKFRLLTESVPNDPPLAHDSPSAVFVEDLKTLKKVRLTPKNLWIPGPAQWVNDHEIVCPGLWHEDYDKKQGRTWIYRLDLKKNWTTATRKDLDPLRLAEGFQVSVRSEKETP